MSSFFANTLVMTDSTMTNNSASNESAAFVGTATVTNSLITNNVGTEIVVSRSGDVHVFTGTTVSGNTSSGRGGGIVSEGDTEITNCMISDNEAAGGGGGLLFFSGFLEVTSSTTTGNVVDGNRAQGGGGLLIGASSNPRVLLRNTIVAGNAWATTGPDV